ncbi:uncharacterized protein LOC125666775 [Ostrea edulis]|uniref:uncharacterized protein LOC125666775 n=1 Tax=Ostrea edulis TaxID=37623 RepID=UPI0024AEB5B7|nr:uncharacterized protein LOC125666775 [Ostrea edulis]
MNFPIVALFLLAVSTCVNSQFRGGMEPSMSRMLSMSRQGPNSISRGGADNLAKQWQLFGGNPSNQYPRRRVLQPIVIRPNIVNRRRNEEMFPMQQLMQLMPLLAMTEGGEGMMDMLLPMMLMQRSARQF